MSTIASEGEHKHELIFLGRLLGELETKSEAGSYPLYQCRECGATFEMFGNGRYAVFQPSMTQQVTEMKESIKFVKDSPRSKKVSQRVLGRGLAELMASGGQPQRGLDKLFNGGKS